jgi:hypothetical protein
MTLYSYVSKTVEQGGWTGVSRFDLMLRRVFPGIVSVTEFPEPSGDDVVITDNHLSLDVPEGIRTVVVHHGCAAVHFERDPAWRTARTLAIVESQKRMMARGDLTFVAPSEWVAEKFLERYRDLRPERAIVIPHWVDPIEPSPDRRENLIVGDWRDNNKGSAVWRRLAQRFRQWEFRPLSFTDDEGRRKQYGEASLYLCLSLSEGGPYAVCDAEAASLPIVTTDVGNCLEFSDSLVISWRIRDDVDAVGAAIGRKLKKGRERPSFYSSYPFDDWRERWRRAAG